MLRAMENRTRVPLSMLSLASVLSEGTIRSALQNTVELASTADRCGFNRFWIAEHHNIPGVASSATAVLIGHVAQLTKRIRVGSGGVMLPNHAPLTVAENFGTLAELYPGRIDLGLGRAPGTDPLTSRALRRNTQTTGDEFPELVSELQAFLAPVEPGQRMQAIPGAGVDVPIWILGSSLFSADFAAAHGLPYAFAGHFAPDHLMDAAAIYRNRFRPSATLSKPYFMVCVPVIAADSDEEAKFLATTTQQKVLGIVTGRRAPSAPAPIENLETLWGEPQRAAVNSFLRELIVGGPETIVQKLEKIRERTQADEIMIHTDMYRCEDIQKSIEITARAWGN